MIESDPVQEFAREETHFIESDSGIFSGATLAKLRDYTANGKPNAVALTTTEPGGPLVGYGSDTDSD